MSRVNKFIYNGLWEISISNNICYWLLDCGRLSNLTCVDLVKKGIFANCLQHPHHNSLSLGSQEVAVEAASMGNLL